MGVAEVLQAAHRPLTTEQIIARVNDKEKRSVYSELNTLRKRREVVKIEIRCAIAELELASPIVIYRWIGPQPKKNNR